jgi:hypothetical protein
VWYNTYTEIVVEVPMEELKMIIAGNIGQLRREAGMTQLELAEYLNYTVNDDYREDLSKGIDLMNKRIRELDWVGLLPSRSTNHREHGNNLYKPD